MEPLIKRLPGYNTITPFGLFEFLYMPFGYITLPRPFNASWIPLFTPFLSLWSASMTCSFSAGTGRITFLIYTRSYLSFLPTALSSIWKVHFCGPWGCFSWPLCDWSFPHPFSCQAHSFLSSSHKCQIPPKLPGHAQLLSPYSSWHCWVLKPLTDATAGTGNLSWTSDMHSSFLSTKSALVSAVPLHHLTLSAGSLPLWPLMLLIPMWVQCFNNVPLVHGSHWPSSPLHISHIFTTSFHPQSNGMVKRFHRHLKPLSRLAALLLIDLFTFVGLSFP